MRLGKPEIERYLASGHITIDEFVPENLGSAQYDVTLGEHFYRERKMSWHRVYNPYDEGHVRGKWEHNLAISHDEWRECSGEWLENVGHDEKLIIIEPGELILGHTQEYIGGSCNFITTKMHARSSLGRNGIEVCRCLPPETEVRRHSGAPALLGEIEVGDGLLNVDRFGRSRRAMVKAVHRSREPKELLRIETSGGRVLTCSTDHLLRVSRSDGLHTVSAATLHVGDELPVLMRWEPNNDESVKLHEARMLGYFVAEGNWQQYIVAFAKNVSKPEERAEIAESFAAVFPSAPKPHFYEDKVQFNSVDLAREFARRYPETACLGKYKRVPRALFAAPREIVQVFLRAYLRCDGHDRESRNEVQTCSRSPELIRDIALLATRVGAVPTFSQRNNGAANRMQYYGLYYGDDAGRIANRITDAPRGQNVYIPDLLSVIKTKYGMTREMLAGYAVTDRKKISRKRLEAIVAAFPREIEELRPYLGDLAWDEVVKIERLAIERTDLIDISLDVETEEDSLFILGDGLAVLNCAGLGDVGYFTRWTMEIVNTSRFQAIALPVGRRVAQLTFDKVEPVAAKDVYDKLGKYQTSSSLAELKAAWGPDQMLPKQWKDRECQKVRAVK